jgi:hypothetical protein
MVGEKEVTIILSVYNIKFVGYNPNDSHRRHLYNF